MAPERWREIDRLYHLALEQEAGLRSGLFGPGVQGR